MYSKSDRVFWAIKSSDGRYVCHSHTAYLGNDYYWLMPFASGIKAQEAINEYKKYQRDWPVDTFKPVRVHMIIEEA